MNAVTFAYHEVLPADSAEPSGFQSADAATYTVTPSLFEAHLDALVASIQASSLRVVPATSDAPQAILTFDDGGVSAWLHAAPALEARGLRGCFFITSRLVGTPGFLDVRQIRDLSDRGHLIGSHSASHRGRMSRMPRERVRAEWRESVDALENITGRRVSAASVPSGYSSRMVAEEADAEGIRYLYTQVPTTRAHMVGQCAVLGRYTVRRWTPPSTVGALASGDLRARTTQRAVWLAKQLPKALPGGLYASVRRSAFRWSDTASAAASSIGPRQGGR